MLEYKSSVSSVRQINTMEESEMNSQGDEVVSQVESMNMEQVKDFVRKLGFMDKEKEGGDKIKHFLHLSQVIIII